MKRWALRLVLGIAALLAIPVVFGALLDRPRINNAVRRFNRDRLNPWMLKRAGRSDWYASTIETLGRRTGTVHRTPVMAEPITGGFLIPLPYGTGVDWLRNARAAGHAVIHQKDIDYPVDRFDVMDADLALPMLPPGHRVSFRLNGTDRFLNARIAHVTGETAGV